MRALDPAPGASSLRLLEDEHDPYVELLEWIFYGRSLAQVMSAEQRIAWMKRQLPRTYSLLSMSHRWLEISDL